MIFGADQKDRRLWERDWAFFVVVPLFYFIIHFFCLYSSISQFRYMPTYTEGSHKSQDALSEVMILVKEEAKTHDLNVLIDVSECTAIAKKGVLVSFQY